MQLSNNLKGVGAQSIDRFPLSIVTINNNPDAGSDLKIQTLP